MSRDYAAVQLLRHGPLSAFQVHVVTGWASVKECALILESLCKAKKLRKLKFNYITLYEAV